MKEKISVEDIIRGIDKIDRMSEDDMKIFSFIEKFYELYLKYRDTKDEFILYKGIADIINNVAEERRIDVEEAKNFFKKLLRTDIKMAYVLMMLFLSIMAERRRSGSILESCRKYGFITADVIIEALQNKQNTL